MKRHEQAKQFFREILERLEYGEAEYGDRSFEDLSEVELVEEISEEVLDICGWAFVLWVRLQRVKEAAGAVRHRG